MAPTIVLITGANRGIGNGLLALYLVKPHHTVIAANRDPNHATSQELHALPKAGGTSLLLIKIDSTLPTDAVNALIQEAPLSSIRLAYTISSSTPP